MAFHGGAEAPSRQVDGLGIIRRHIAEFEHMASVTAQRDARDRRLPDAFAGVDR